MNNIKQIREIPQNKKLETAQHAVEELHRVLTPLLEIEKSRLEQKLMQLKAIQETLKAEKND